MSDQNETVLITGASSGIGFAVARAFLERGSNLVLNSRDSARLEAAYESLGRPDNVLLVAGDVSDKSVGRRMVDAALEKFGRVDVLVNNAGVFSPKPFLDVEEADLDRYYAINLKGTYFTSQAAIPAMQSQGGGAITKGFEGGNVQGSERGRKCSGATRLDPGSTRSVSGGRRGRPV